jgi:hypothetical protein
MSELIPVGTTLVNSADFTITAGGSATLYIKSGAVSAPPSGQDYLLQYKASDGNYSTVAVLNVQNIAQMGNVIGLGTFRVQRQASTYASGMDIQQ